MGIKVLKKIRRNFRCGARFATNNNAASGNSDLRPLQFHYSHSENIRVSRDGAVARRVESFCKGISFSNRPIKVNEKIYLKVVETSTSWSGVLRFGFTTMDPQNVRPMSLPKYTCPDLTNKPGNWGKALAERYAYRDNIIYFYVNNNGEVHYGVNGEDKGIFFSGVDVSSPLWALIDMYGNTIAIEIIDPNQHLNNNRLQQQRAQTPTRERPPVTDNVIGQMSTLSINDNLPSRFYAGVNFSSLPFHSQTKGLNVVFSDRCKVAARKATEYSNGYVFTSRPLKVNETYVLQVLETDAAYVGSMAFGLTSCDPSTVSSRELPQDSDHLLDRPEYWVVSRDVAASPNRGDELMFRISSNGEVRFQKNGMAPVTIMHVDHSLSLWAFVNIFGHTIKIRSLGSFLESPSSCQQQQQQQVLLPPSNFGENPLIRTCDDSFPGAGPGQSSECAVCYENPIDSVLYMCGHMCMCYKCAVSQWRGNGSGKCPICRAIIRDVIRIYKS